MKWNISDSLPVRMALGALCFCWLSPLCAKAQGAPELLDKAEAAAMLPDYYLHRAEQRVTALRARYKSAEIGGSQANLRAALRQTGLLPTTEPTQATRQRVVTLDGLRVEQILLRTRPGVVSPALIYLPPGASETGTKRFPALLMLPGHGDWTWSASVQSRCLGMAKQGYLVMYVQPFGQAERGENPLWNEDHDSQAMAFLLTAGQSLFGLITADHLAEIAYLRGRDDVNPAQIGVTGVSMGGTHSVWLSALEPAIKAAVAVASTPLYQPNLTLQHQGLCDLIPGAYKVADMKMIEALIAPRALLNIYPSTGQPLTDEGMVLYRQGKVTTEADVKRYSMNAKEREEYHRYQHEAYSKAGASKAYADTVVEGPHDYTRPMREAAAGWFALHLKGTGGGKSLDEPAIAPVADQQAARSLLSVWPKGERPHDVLSPTAYAQKEIAAQIAKLPAAPESQEDWQQKRSHIQAALRNRLGVSVESPEMRVTDQGTLPIDQEKVHRLVVEPERGILLPVLLFEPASGVRRDGRMIVLLDPAGKSATADSALRRQLSQEGAWTLCVDLRGMGETHYPLESGYYLGFRDYDIAVAALKFGETLAGYWTKDLLAVIKAARKIAGSDCRVTVRGDRETGLIALFAAGLSDTIQAVETTGLLASCYSAAGYGLPYAYRNQANQDPGKRALGGYGSMVPCIPSLLEAGDIPQFAALIAPRSLLIETPHQADGHPAAEQNRARAFAWTRAVYQTVHADAKLQVN